MVLFRTKGSGGEGGISRGGECGLSKVGSGGGDLFFLRVVVFRSEFLSLSNLLGLTTKSLCCGISLKDSFGIERGISGSFIGMIEGKLTFSNTLSCCGSFLGIEGKLDASPVCTPLSDKKV